MRLGKSWGKVGLRSLKRKENWGFGDFFLLYGTMEIPLSLYLHLRLTEARARCIRRGPLKSPNPQLSPSAGVACGSSWLTSLLGSVI